MSIDVLYATAVFALIVILAPWIMRAVIWMIEVVEARHRRRHAARRRARVKGYLPIFDEQYDPMERGTG